MKFAARISHILPSVTLGLNERTLDLRRKGHDIISLGVGEPDIDTPELVCQRAIEAINNRETRYTPTAGTLVLRKAIVGYVKEVYGLDYAISEVMASSGAKQVLYNSVLATADKDSEFIISSPYWTSYPEMVHLSGADLVVAETKAENDFKLTPEILDAAITKRTSALLLNSPSNPSGVTYTFRELEGLGEVLENRDIWILSDDIYCNLLFDGNQFASIASIPSFRDKTIIINGVSKTFSMTGWRIGFAAAPTNAIAAMTKIQDHSTSCPNAIAQSAAAEALRQGPALTQTWVDSLEQRRDLMLDLVGKIPNVRVTIPQGAFYLWNDVNAYMGKGGIRSTLDLADRMLVAGGVSTVPGEAFGTPGYLRLSFAVTEEHIREGVKRMASCLKKLV